MSIAISLRAQHNGPSGVPTSFRFRGGDTTGGGKLTEVGTGAEGGGADASELDSGATDISTVETLPQEPRSIAINIRAGRIFTQDFVTPRSTFAWRFDCTGTSVVEPKSLFKINDCFHEDIFATMRTTFFAIFFGSVIQKSRRRAEHELLVGQQRPAQVVEEGSDFYVGDY